MLKKLYIVHMVRYSMNFVPWMDKKKLAADLEAICTTNTMESLSSVNSYSGE